MSKQHVSAGVHAPSSRTGWTTLVALAVLSVAEFWVAFSFKSGILVPLVIVALIKSGYIANSFMHFTQLWHVEEDAR